MARRTLSAFALLVALAAPALVGAHAERITLAPARSGAVPDQNRAPTEVINVCKVTDDPECDFLHIQAAVTEAKDGALIQIWPGLYSEEPSRAAPVLLPDLPDGTYSYDFQLSHPNSDNLIAIVGKKNITLRGMGDDSADVVIDVDFTKHVGIRGDRADGLIVENLSVWHAYDHGVYILESDGFVVDRVFAGYNRDYGFLFFASDHGVAKNCEATGSGDAGIYPGGEANTPGRYSVEISNCKAYHNVIGYSGTQGNYVWVHDSEFYDNAAGLTSDSESDHPNYPQTGLVLERNKFYDNNFNAYATTSDVRPTVGVGSVLIPVGTGAFLVSGHDNVVRNNDIWGHERYGVWLASGQAVVLGPTGPVTGEGPAWLPFFSGNNRFLGNRMYGASPNAIDFAWDGLGVNNCWEANVRTPGGEPANTDAAFIPPCTMPVISDPYDPNAPLPVGAGGNPMPATAGVPNPANMFAQAGIVFAGDRPLACYLEDCIAKDWWGPGPSAPANIPAEEGGSPVSPPAPAACGPSTC